MRGEATQLVNPNKKHLDQFKDRQIAKRMVEAFEKAEREHAISGMSIAMAMLMLKAAREAEIEIEKDLKSKTTNKEKSDRLFTESQKICEDCFDPYHARVWADALSKD